ncbi:hypothetical protein [Protaetiibacter larvae]|uniref:Leucine rich repeat variant domain-containing protein n=1 Tax=Protaetiibacter larvae TaxID=2592654 RepID=A0A5C1Y7G2_9MICO|nr:hypothetical protein [Protaetiibacter larvae]QEO08842.1 hypothetical protein FLP23_01700 [Protaetiibacter larvae]
MVGERDDAWAQLHDPTTDAARLMEIAQAHPEFAAQIEAHPNVYPGLVDWLHEHAAAGPAATPETSPDAAAATAAAADAPFGPRPAPRVRAAMSRRARTVLLTAGAVVALGAIAVGAVFVVQAIQRGSDARPEAAGGDGDVARAADYRLGAEVTWSLEPPLEVQPNVDYRGITARPILSDEVWLTQWVTDTAGNGAVVGDALVAVDAADGEVLWTDAGYRRECADRLIDDSLVCADQDTQRVQVFDAASGPVAGAPLAGRAANGVMGYDDTALVAVERMGDSGHDELTFGRYELDGTTVWEFTRDCEFGAPPSAGAGSAALFFPMGEGKVLAHGSCWGGYVDVETGEVLEEGSAEEYFVPGIGGDDSWGIVGEVQVAVDEGALVGFTDNSPDNQLWRVELGLGDAYWQFFAADDAPNAPLLLVGDERMLRVDPLLPPTRVDGMPDELPDCPAGWTPVAWSEWDGGITLVCQEVSGSSFRAFRVGGGETSSDDVEVTPTGYRIVFEDGELELALGGWWVLDDSETAVGAIRGWTAGRAEAASYPELPSGVQACPSGTFPLSLSLWRGGWLLVCGLASDSPSSLRFVDGERSGIGEAYLDGDRVCGVDQEGVELCVSAAPALVQFSADGGVPTQRSVTDNYFAGRGEGGAGRGTGAYGVETPDDTPEQQVAYLVAVLQKSAEARSTVGAVLAPLNACSVDGADIEALQRLLQARTDLLAALRTTPVDQVPGGADLLAQLVRALELSELADQQYVDTANQMATGDCAGGRATYRVAIATADQAEAAKQAFVASWNATIPAQFGAPSYSAGDI